MFAAASEATPRIAVITRLVRNCALERVTQYSRDISDWIERPRRTGCPAGACHRARIRATRWRGM